jgi:4'-phosphopantetheinyl transferase
MKCERSIDVWLADDEIADQGLLVEYRRLLTAEERAQEHRFHFARDQRRYLVTRALVRTVLSRYLDIEPTEWRFAPDYYGRPWIVNAGREHRGLCFNISHTQGLIAVGVTWHRELGVDVEHVSARPVSLEIAARFFAGPEAAELATVPAERQQERFFEYWTFKESYIKARGAGLSIPLEQFSFHYPHERAVRIEIQPQLRDHAGRWQFWQLRPTDHHLLAICAERRDGTAPTLTIRKTIPLVSEQVVAARVSRASEPECVQ